jgi:hypothetical protein
VERVASGPVRLSPALHRRANLARPRGRSPRWPALALALLGLSGCTLLSDLDGLEGGLGPTDGGGDAGPLPEGEAIVGVPSRKCIDVQGGIARDGAPLELRTCAPSSPTQRWTFGYEGTVRVQGLCMDVAWGSTFDGATIQLAVCTGNPAQQFTLNASNDLVNPQADKCVDVRDSSSADGARLQLWTCTGADHQKWFRQP